MKNTYIQNKRKKNPLYLILIYILKHFTSHLSNGFVVANHGIGIIVILHFLQVIFVDEIVNE